MTDHIDEARKLEPEWRYEIQYGPEGEANYAWIYKGGLFVATMRTHHAVEIVKAIAALAAALERGRIEERERCAKVELPLTRTLGALGAAFDPPGPHRAYTYEHQPHNGPAYSLGCAVAAAKNMPAGDEIDVGLALLKAMQAQGFGVFEIKPSAITKEPTP